MIRFFQILAFVLVASVAQATTYYIDYVAGSDSNNGTSEATPWKHFPMDSRATGTTAGNTSIVAGDVLAPKGGVVYVTSGYMVVPSGSAGNPVVVDGSLWGTGKAEMTSNNQGLGMWTDYIYVRSNFTFKNIFFYDVGGFDENDPIYDGITITAVDTSTEVFTGSVDHNFLIGDRVQFTRETSATYPTTSPQIGSGTSGIENIYYVKTTPSDTTFTLAPVAGGTTINITAAGTGVIKAWKPIENPGEVKVFSFVNGGQNMIFQNLDFQEIGQWKNTPPMRGTGSVPGLGFLFYSPQNLLIEDCTFKRMKGGVGVNAVPSIGTASNITINRCVFTDHLMWALDFAPRAAGGTFDGVTVSNCTIYDYFQFDDGNWKGFGDKPHTNGIFIRNSQVNGVWNNIKVHGCKFYADNSGASLGGTSDIFISEGPSVLVYNNVFWKNPKTNGHVSVAWNNYWATQPQVVRVYNNTFHGSVSPCRTQRDSATGATRSVHYANNLWIGAGSSTNLPVTTQWDHLTTPKFTTLNRNLYWHPTFTKSQINGFAINGWYWATFENVQSMGVSPPNPTQFEGDSKFQNPLIADMVGSFLNQDWRVQVGSPAIGLGYNLSEYFTTDIDGNARPASGAWTVGAYEYGGAPPADVTAPTYISGSVNSSGETVSVVFSEPVQGIDLTHYAISGHSLSGLTGAGANWSFTISPIRQAGASFSMTYTSGAGRTRDLADNLLATGTFTVANGSLEETPIPPLPGRRGVGKPRILMR